MKIKITKTQETIDDVVTETTWMVELSDLENGYDKEIINLTYPEISALKEALAKIPAPNQ